MNNGFDLWTGVLITELSIKNMKAKYLGLDILFYNKPYTRITKHFVYHPNKLHSFWAFMQFYKS